MSDDPCDCGHDPNDPTCTCGHAAADHDCDQGFCLLVACECMHYLRPTGPPSAAAMLAEFHAAFGQPFGHGSLNDSVLRRRLHIEEHIELIEALDSGDLVSVAHELADVVYVAFGTAHSLGIPLDAVLAEVHRANMSKFGPDGRPVLRDDGKVLKSDRFVPPDVAGVLDLPRSRSAGR